MMVLGLELAVVLELERRGGPSQGSAEEAAAAASGPGSSVRSGNFWNSTSLASPSAAWLGGSKAKGDNQDFIIKILLGHGLSSFIHEASHESSFPQKGYRLVVFITAYPTTPCFYRAVPFAH